MTRVHWFAVPVGELFVQFVGERESRISTVRQHDALNCAMAGESGVQ
jgi:hypothetical protein